MRTKIANPDLEYYMGKLQPDYESTAQAKIGRMMDEYAIPFFYKQPLLVWENGRRRIKRPDFTLPTYNNTVIEYVPLRDEAAKRDSHLYRQNNITALFLKDSDLANPNWQQRLYEKLEEIYHRPRSLLVDSYQPN